jgi:hypothetical protein
MKPEGQPMESPPPPKITRLRPGISRDAAAIIAAIDRLIAAVDRAANIAAAPSKSQQTRNTKQSDHATI